MQGGDDGATNQTNMSPPLIGWDIQSYTVSNEPPFTPPFPQNLDSEFEMGRLIRNSFGTIAMAMSSATNSANSSFFFDLVDNSTSGYDLDGQGFTVFGRIMNDSNYTVSSNVLAYFNTLSNGFGAVNPVTFMDYGVSNTIPGVSGSLLPVNYTGTNAPANSNLVFVNFSFPNGAPPTNTDTNAPSVSITTAAAPTLITNGLLQGTANDTIGGVAEVICAVTGVAVGGVYPSSYTNRPTTNYAVGGTNWSLSLFPGTYNVSVQSQNGAGYLSATATNIVTLTGFESYGVGTVSLYAGSNFITTNIVGYPLQQGVTYTWKATPGPGQTFLKWELNGNVSTATNLTFSYGGSVLTATFLPLTTPHGTKGISFTYPTSKQKVPTNSFMLKGKLASSFGPAQVSVQIYSTNSDVEVVAPLMVNATNTFEIPITNLAPDDYQVVAIATNSKYSSVISENFSVINFKPVAGTYTGLFINELGATGPFTSGSVNCTVSASGAFSIKISFPVYPSFSYNGQFNSLGNGPSFHPPLYGNAATIGSLTLDLSAGANQLTGIIYSDTYSWYSPFVCYRAATKLTDATKPAPGKYILRLDTTNTSATEGYAALSVNGNGTLNVAGTLPDGSTFSESTRVSTNGIWPIYAVPSGYRASGMLIGWATNFASGACGARLSWYKAPGLGQYYTNGVSTLCYCHWDKLPAARGGHVFADSTAVDKRCASDERRDRGRDAAQCGQHNGQGGHFAVIKRSLDRAFCRDEFQQGAPVQRGLL